MTAPAWVTATPPTPNGDLHLGHMAGPYVAADVLRRYLAAEGSPVLMTTGMDDHQSYVPMRGVRSGHTAEQVAAHYGKRIAAAWRDAGVRFDRIVEPRRTPGYVEFVQGFFHKLYDRGVLVPRTKPLPFCPRCDRWLYEAFVSGRCPHCGESSNGNACEACARPNHCGDLSDPVCLICAERAQLRDHTRLFLPLEPFAEKLARFWDSVRMPPRLRALCQAMAADGLPEIAVSHPSGWGVPVPAALGFEGQRIYVWFEMAPGYLLEFAPPTARPPAGPVQFFGFDNGYFHAVLFPALFMAWDPDLPLPAAFVVNEFYRYEGKKFSTSRQHAVWARDGLADAGADAVRLHVMRDRPNGRQTNFTRGDLERARAHLHGAWNGWLARLMANLDADTGGVVPGEQPGGEGWTVLRTRLTRLAEDLRDAYSLPGFDPRRAVSLLDELVRCVSDFGYLHEHEPRPHSRRAALSAQLAVASALAAWAGPALPAGAGRLSQMLGVPSPRPVDASALIPPPAGSRLTPPTGPIFGS
jgi:methionyl-tRNA synthetase